MSYVKTNWVNGKTPLNAENMNHIEDGIEQSSNNSNMKLIPISLGSRSFTVSKAELEKYKKIAVGAIFDSSVIGTGYFDCDYARATNDPTPLSWSIFGASILTIPTKYLMTYNASISGDTYTFNVKTIGHYDNDSGIYVSDLQESGAWGFWNVYLIK